jgi:hypothetical protein
VFRKLLTCPAHRLFPLGQLLKIIAVSSVGAVAILAVRPLVPSGMAVLMLVVSTLVYGGITAVLFVLLGWVNPLAMLHGIKAVLRGRFAQG